jgi:preprotein translocase subunit SecE
MTDKLKIGFAGLLVIAGVVAFYWFSAAPGIARAGMVVLGVLLGAAVAWFSEPGQQFMQFARESVTEVKKVVWPTRKESLQTTAAVFAFVVIMAVFLWIVDKILEWGLYDLVLGWRK